MMAIKKTSKQNLGHYSAGTFDFGKLIPVDAVEVIQGDTFALNTQAFLRLNPLVFPVIQPVWVRLHHWFVPYRILWSGFQDFITGKDLSRVFPFFKNSGSLKHTNDSPLVCMGILPSGYPVASPYPALPLLAYWKIWKEFYADEQLDENMINKVQNLLDRFNDPTNPIILKGGDLTNDNNTTTGYGPNGFSINELASVAWHKDYFTGARPTPIIGPEITVPVDFDESASPAQTTMKLGGSLTFAANAPFINAGANVFLPTGGNKSLIALGSSGGDNQIPPADMSEVTLNASVLSSNNSILNGTGVSGLSVNLSDLMASFALQRLFQKQNEYGNRYQEWLANQGVRYSDRALQLPQYIGGAKSLFDINDVIQTSANQLGNFAGRATAAVGSRRHFAYFEEPGIVLTLCSIVPKNMYQIQGIRKNWSRRTFEETYQPELEHLDMQPIKNSEIFIQNTAADNEVFGYTPRYDELRTCESYVFGELVKNGTYSEFTMARSFTALPILNSSFIACNPTKEIFYSQTEPAGVGVWKHNIIARRHLIKRSHIKLV